MRTTKEVALADLVAKYKKHLVRRGTKLIRQDRREQARRGLEPTAGVAVFKQLLEGCLLTLLYTRNEGHQLVILDWHDTEPAHN
jgi:hypothetical protein